MTTPCFNPRTPCGVRHTGTGGFLLRTKFQSTHSLRSATPPAFSKIILSPVSIHALLAECDPRWAGTDHCMPRFNPRTPCGVRLGFTFVDCEDERVSIHALLAECDDTFLLHPNVRGGFNPRTPCGVRPFIMLVAGPFLPVSIHALLAECDRGAGCRRCRCPCFNPRTPCGVRRSST